MSGTYFNTVTLSNYGTQNPFTVTLSGLVSVSNGNAIIGTAGYAWTLFNRGTIASSSGVGVDLTKGGSVTNGQSGSTAGLISAGFRAVEIDSNAGTVINYGTIKGAIGPYGVGPSTLVSSGSIAGGMRVDEYSTATNNGSITGAVYLASGTVINPG
jgi:hypothetical protein